MRWLISFKQLFGGSKHAGCYSKFCGNMRLSIHESKIILAVFLDFSKAFDLLLFDILILKLRAMGFSDTVIKWIISSLKGR